MSDYMPDDLLLKIFALLPPKSLVRFTCVCKSWQSLITSSIFITDHLNRNKLSNTKGLILTRSYYPRNREKVRYSLRIDCHPTFDEYNFIELPFRCYPFYHFYRPIGSSNGLICLSENHGLITHNVILWNPSIRKCLTLPLPNFTFSTHGPYDHAIGFGFDSRINDFKVVTIACLRSESVRSLKVELYKLSTGYWETITPTVDPSLIVYGKFTTQAFINGAVHWLAFKMDTGALIVSFNMTDDLFHEMMLPAGVVENHFVSQMSVKVCGEWLSFFHYTTYDESCSVWVMKEYGVVESWAKLYTFDPNGELGKMLGFRVNGEILMAMVNRDLFSYEPETRKIKYLGIRDSYTNFDSFYVDDYVESIVLLGMQTDVERTCDN